MVSGPAGGAAEDQAVVIIHSFDNHTEWMDRPTLLEKGPAAKDLSHRSPLVLVSDHNFQSASISRTPTT